MVGWGVFSPASRALLSALAVVPERLACLDPAVFHVTLLPRGTVDSPKHYGEGVLHVWGFRTVFVLLAHDLQVLPCLAAQGLEGWRL